MKWEQPPTLKQFSEKFLEYVDDTGVLKNAQGMIYGHDIVGQVFVTCENTDEVFEIVGLSLHQLGGCGCSVDVEIVIKKQENIK